MADIILDSIATYFSSLTATNNICSELGTTFSSGTNLFIGTEPIDIATCLTITPYSGSPPSPEGDRQNPNVQIRLKCRSRQSALKTMQSIINTLHTNTKVCTGKIFANQSIPIIWEYQQGGEFIVTISNYNIKHIKL